MRPLGSIRAKGRASTESVLVCKWRVRLEFLGVSEVAAELNRLQRAIHGQYEQDSTTTFRRQ